MTFADVSGGGPLMYFSIMFLLSFLSAITTRCRLKTLRSGLVSLNVISELSCIKCNTKIAVLKYYLSENAHSQTFTIHATKIHHL